MEQTEPFDSISLDQASKLLGISKPTLRYYESQGLIAPHRGQKNKYRRYSFLDLVELTDIILLRKLGVPVKELPDALNSTVEKSHDIISESVSSLYESLEDILSNLKALENKRHRLEKCMDLQRIPYKLVESTGLPAIVEFDLTKAEQTKIYLENPQNSIVYFSDPNHPDLFVDGLIACQGIDNAQIIWDPAEYPGAFMECLLVADYAFTQNNNLSQHLDYLESQGFKADFAIGNYLLSGRDSSSEARRDYYQLWIKVS